MKIFFAEGRFKAFPTGTSHLTVFANFQGTLLFIFQIEFLLFSELRQNNLTVLHPCESHAKSSDLQPTEQGFEKTLEKLKNKLKNWKIKDGFKYIMNVQTHIVLIVFIKLYGIVCEFL